MRKQGDVIILDKEELDEIIELECNQRLNMTLNEFLSGWRQGVLPRSTATREIEMLVKLAYEK